MSEEYNTATIHAAKSLASEIEGYETYKWMTTTEEVKSDPELHNIIASAMETEKQHAQQFLNYLATRVK